MGEGGRTDEDVDPLGVRGKDVVLEAGVSRVQWTKGWGKGKGRT